MPTLKESRFIKPISVDVAAKIKSSIAINSLDDVVAGLIRNSLDALACNIFLEVSCNHGFCRCEDDGMGIHEKRLNDYSAIETGYTFNQPFLNDNQDRNTVFLSSLSVLSHMSIVSKTPETLLNSVVFHHGSVQDRHAEASSHEQLREVTSGTVVVVKDLFKEMPVRVKQRALKAASEPQKTWQTLVDTVIALLLAYHAPVQLSLSDRDLDVQIKVDTRRISVSNFSADLVFTLLTQSNLVAFDTKASWVPLAASTSLAKVKGAISLDPAPTNQIQFVSIGKEPLRLGIVASEVITVVNQVFKSSRFGVSEDDIPDDAQKARPQSHKRFKKEGYSGCELRRARRSIDRWPKFYIRVEIRAPDRSNSSTLTDDAPFSESSVAVIVDIIGRAVTEWLHKHNFHPRVWKLRRGQFEPCEGKWVQGNTRSQVSPGLCHPDKSKEVAMSVCSKMSKGTEHAGGREPPRQTAHGTLCRWSNMKCDEKDSFVQEHQLSRCSRGSRVELQHHRDPTNRVSVAFTEDAPVNHLTGADCTTSEADRSYGLRSQQTATFDNLRPKARLADDTAVWTDNVSGRRYSLNTRSGIVRPLATVRRPRLSMRVKQYICAPLPPTSTQEVTGHVMAKVGSDQDERRSGKSPVLKNWENPVFLPSTIGISRVSNVTFEGESRSAVCLPNHTGHGICTPETSSGWTLQRAQAIAQVDRKYILIKCSDQQSSLALIDQHAASERNIVEKLFAEICQIRNPNDHCDSRTSKTALFPTDMTSHKVLRDPIPLQLSAAEVQMCREQINAFAQWGITYKIGDCADTAQLGASRIQKQNSRLYVLTLPALVAERFVSDAGMLSKLIRSSIHRGRHKVSMPKDDAMHKQHAWLHNISDCPEGIIEALKSRACRSAIMFNDVLTPVECARIVKRLARCAFPTICAHSRPSVVPLVTWDTSGCGAAAKNDMEFDRQLFEWMADANNAYLRAPAEYL